MAAAGLIAAAGASAAPAEEDAAVSREDICAVAARPELPGYDYAGDPVSGVDVNAVVDGTDWRSVSWRDCPSGSGAVETMRFSPDGRYALTEGGWQAGPLEGGWGYCLFRKTEAGWAPVDCVTTAIS
jgi:hypothetical protein